MSAGFICNALKVSYLNDTYAFATNTGFHFATIKQKPNLAVVKKEMLFQDSSITFVEELDDKGLFFITTKKSWFFFNAKLKQITKLIPIENVFPNKTNILLSIQKILIK